MKKRNTQVNELPDEIKVVIPAQEHFNTEKFTDPERCYMCDALRLMGYKDRILCDPDYVNIGSMVYMINPSLTKELLEAGFKDKKNIKVLLTKRVI